MKNRSALAMVASLLLLAGPAFAHPGSSALGGLASGFVHPVTGLDHIVAMLAVGLWGAILGGPALWVLPITFPLVMALGGAGGMAGFPVIGVETAIALSGVVLGLMVVTRARPPLWVAAMIVSAFAFFHGYAHGTELPGSAKPLHFAAGFVLATLLLHLSGLATGLVFRSPLGLTLIRLLGGAIALTGAAFLSGMA